MIPRCEYRQGPRLNIRGKGNIFVFGFICIASAGPWARMIVPLRHWSCGIRQKNRFFGGLMCS